MGFLQTVGEAVAKYAVPPLQSALEKQVEKYFPILMEKLLALIPMMAATVAKTVAEEIVKNLPDIDIPVISDVFDLTETVRQAVNGSIPDIDIPILSDIFDLTDFLNKGR